MAGGGGTVLVVVALVVVVGLGRVVVVAVETGTVVAGAAAGERLQPRAPSSDARQTAAKRALMVGMQGTRLNEVEIFAADLDRALHVYRDLIGVPLAGHTHSEGDAVHYHAAWGAGETFLFFSLYPADADAGATRTSLGFAVTDLDALHAAMQEAGLRVVQEIEERPWGSRTALYQDDDGNRIWLSE